MDEIRFGVLQLEQGKTYGRQIKSNGKSGKLYFGIMPEVRTDIPVKVAYELYKTKGKPETICNLRKNRFVSYKIIGHHTSERPIANLVDNYGPVDNLDALIRYRFSVKDLVLNPKFGKNLYSSLSDIHKHACDSVQTFSKYEPIPIITIDPVGCKDIDDGVGLTNNVDGTYTISICITHLPSYLTSHHIIQEELEELLHNPCSVYLPENTVHMFDKTFSLSLFSLTEGKTCPVLCLRLTIDDNGMIVKKKLDVQLARIIRNHSYDSEDLLKDKTYINLARLVKMCFIHNPVMMLNSIVDSHDIVAYLMILMNEYSAQVLWEMKRGLFRKSKAISESTLPAELLHLKHIVCNRASNYVCYSSIGENPYCHITSPMRRLPDLVNMIILTSYLYPSSECHKFERMVCSSINNVDTIDRLCKSAKRIGDEAKLLHDVTLHKIDINRTYEGIVIETIRQNPNKYDVYVEELGRWFKVKTMQILQQFDKVRCHIILFEKADTFVKKVRLCLEIDRIRS